MPSRPAIWTWAWLVLLCGGAAQAQLLDAGQQPPTGGPPPFMPTADPTGFLPPANPTSFTTPANPPSFTPEANPTSFTPPAGPTGFMPPAGPTGFVPPAGPPSFGPAANSPAFFASGEHAGFHSGHGFAEFPPVTDPGVPVFASAATVSGGFVGGMEAAYLKFAISDNSAVTHVTDTYAGLNAIHTSTSLPYEFDYTVCPRFWFGYVTDSGLGFRVRYEYYDLNSSVSVAQGSPAGRRERRLLLSQCQLLHLLKPIPPPAAGRHRADDLPPADGHHRRGGHAGGCLGAVAGQFRRRPALRQLPVGPEVLVDGIGHDAISL